MSAEPFDTLLNGGYLRTASVSPPQVLHRNALLHYEQYYHRFHTSNQQRQELGSVVEQFDGVTMYKFAPASENESIVFGSARPGYKNEQVNEWIDFMQNQDIQRVCCLLPESQLTRYSNLLDVYRQTLGRNQVCWTPVEDFHFTDPGILIYQILPFLALANQHQEKVVVHCSGGVGRTGHVLAAWLVAGRGLSNQAGIAAVKQTGKNPHEAVIAAPFKGRNPWKVAAELNTLLDECHQFRGK